MNNLLVLIILTVCTKCYAQLDSLNFYEIIDSSINLSIKYNEKWRKQNTQNSTTITDNQNNYIPVIHIESNPNYISEINSSPSVVSALIVTKQSNIDTTIVHNEDEYLNQIKLEMEQFYNHLQFKDETHSILVKRKKLRSLKASVTAMGYQFYQEYITYIFDKKYITIVLLYSDNDTRSELKSFISFIDE
jgi:hypothetical protein